MESSKVISTEVGFLKITVKDYKLIGVTKAETGDKVDCKNSLIDEVEHQLREYLCGRLKVFDLPLELKGNEFDLKVLDAVRKIPYGELRSYKDLSEKRRLVGKVLSNNLLILVVPCHRVIRSNGDLGGYILGTEVKKWLIDLERRFLD